MTIASSPLVITADPLQQISTEPRRQNREDRERAAKSDNETGVQPSKQAIECLFLLRRYGSFAGGGEGSG